MASINKISIRGVRSFSPDDQEQVVEFLFPLTIITGANGCGKTTIIESLKFALSGSLPPSGGTRSAGQNFLSDPRSIGHSVVKANIKLRFTNKAGNGMVVIRSMELTQKKTTMQFKQLDGVIRTIDSETGERVSLSHKCGELDKQIPSLLGVSKAILDYVLFVHQEDSSWPLQEASVLKKRFDDIFDSTRYSKALESFRKTKKELMSQAKDIKAEVSGLASSKHAAKIFRKDMDEQNKNLEELEEQMSHAKNEIAEAKKEDDRLYKIIEAVNEIEDRMDKKVREMQNLRAVIEKQKKMLEKDLTEQHDLKQLEEKLKDFDKEMKKEQQRKAELAQKSEAIQKEIESLRKQEMALNSSKGKLAAEKEAHEKRLRDRIALMEKIAQSYTLDLQQSLTQLSRLESSFTMSQASFAGRSETPEALLSGEDMESFFNALDKKEKEMKEGLRSHKAKFRSQEDECNAVLQELVGKRNAFENERSKLNAENKDIDRELRDLSTKFGPKRMKKSSLDDVREQAHIAAKDLERKTKDDTRDKLGAEIRSHNEKIDQLKEDIERQETIRNRLKTSAGLQARIAMMEETAEREKKVLEECIESQTEKLSSFNIAVPDVRSGVVACIYDVSDAVESKYQEAKRKAAKSNEEKSKERQHLTSSTVELQSASRSLAELEMKKSALDQSSSNVGKVKRVVEEMSSSGFDNDWKIEHGGEPQELLEFLSNHLKELEEDSPEDVPPHILTVIARRIRNLGKGSSQCPCCTRHFSGNEQKVFLDKMKALADRDSSPLIKGGDKTELQKYREVKATVERWLKVVRSCTPSLHEYKNILKEIAEHQPRILALENLLATKKKALSSLESEAKAAEQEETELRDLQEMTKRWRADAGRIEEQESNIADKRDQLQCETSDNSGEGSLEQVEEELERMREEQAGLYDKINKTNKKISSMNEEISLAQTKANKTAELLRAKEKKFAEEEQALKRKGSLEERKTSICLEITKLGEKISSLQQKIKAKESEKSRLYSHANDEETKLNETLNLFLSDVKHLKEATSAINEYGSTGKGDSLDQLAAEVASVVEAMKEQNKALAKLQPDLTAVSKAVDDQERHRKLLHDNIDLLKTLDRIAQLEEEITELKHEKGEVEGHETAEMLAEEAQETMNKNQAIIARLEGRRSEIIEQIRSLNRKLQSEEYRDVDKRHREEVIKQETTLLAIKDLDNYANALDKALLRFHGIKISSINTIIKELWLLTYKGEDITSIELESGQDSRAAKSYNYRVVMTKGSTKMDMRGRCSAGQRVLASIVIRLALAETFGVHCGCLVLDEPTVNLDYENRKGLAVALAQIISDRSKQSNFQLVLITHDEDFVSLMKDELSTQTGFSMPEKYFQVRREESSDGKFYSKIEAIDWDELL